jgi:hypothetical protein
MLSRATCSTPMKISSAQSMSNWWKITPQFELIGPTIQLVERHHYMTEVVLD